MMLTFHRVVATRKPKEVKTMFYVWLFELSAVVDGPWQALIDMAGYRGFSLWTVNKYYGYKLW